LGWESALTGGSRGFRGDTLNTAVYLARLRTTVEYATAVGDDPHRDEMLRAWEAEGVGTSLILRVASQLPGLYLIQTDQEGERRFSYWRDHSPVRRLFDLPDTPRIGTALAAADVLYLSGIALSLFRASSRERLFGLLEAVQTRGGQVVFDTNFRPRGWPDRDEARAAFGRALKLSHTVLAAVEDFALLEAECTADQLLRRLRDAGVVEAVVGLGTVLTQGDLDLACRLGVHFAFSPGATPELLGAAAEAGIPFVPGVATASELMTAMARGFSTVKLFPAAQLGGVVALRALGAPFPDARFCPTGGISETEARDYLALPNVLAVGGSWLAPAAKVAAGEWGAIETLARRAMAGLAS
jgi:Entner-Doudoroff aldolase